MHAVGESVRQSLAFLTESKSQKGCVFNSAVQIPLLWQCKIAQTLEIKFNFCEIGLNEAEKTDDLRILYLALCCQFRMTWVLQRSVRSLSVTYESLTCQRASLITLAKSGQVKQFFQPVWDGEKDMVWSEALLCPLQFVIIMWGSPYGNLILENFVWNWGQAEFKTKSFFMQYNIFS